MSTEVKTTAISITLTEQITGFSQLTHKINATLADSRVPLPTGVAQNLTYLAHSLERISKKIHEHEEERQDLLALADISQVVNSSLDLNTVLQIVMDTIIRLTGAERGFLMLRGETGELEMRIARNWEQASLNPSEFAISRTVINRVVAEGKPVLTTNAQEDDRFVGQASIIAFSLRSILCVPLMMKDVLTGVIYTDNRIKTGLFSEKERNLLNAFANQAAIAIENARLFESVRRTLAEVTELKNLMDNVFASIVSGVITADVEDKITLCNLAASHILGHDIVGLIGKPLNDLLPPIAGDLSTHIASARSNGLHVVGQEYRVAMPNRGDLDLSLNISPLKDATDSTQGVAIVLDDLTEKKRLEAQRRLFERMVSPAIIKVLDPNQLQLGGKRGEITTIFADVRGFTSYSERLAPEVLLSVLNQYLAAAADAVLANDGTIDKFMGDAIMAWFNAPLPQADHTLRAVKSALAIRDALARLHAELPPESHLSFGVGIHFGEAVLGLVGTEKRLEYTAIGDSVNTAKRIQENSAAGQILMSAPAYAFVKDQVIVRPVEPIHAKGKREPVPVFEVMGLL
ncbi:MAG: GAF domain-containing protein [Anaerolineales bacterium]|nr:GAF domain-containing protein [Anaerolineales bacterium]